MVAAHARLQPTATFGLAVSGWTLGPSVWGGAAPRDASWLNDKLPPSVAIGAMNVECGHA